MSSAVVCSTFGTLPLHSILNFLTQLQLYCNIWLMLNVVVQLEIGWMLITA